MDTLGSRIAYYRRQLRISQEKLAEILGVSRQAVTKWENDKTAPATENLFRLAEVLGISMGELTGSELEREEEKLRKILAKEEEKVTKEMTESGRLPSVCSIISCIILILYFVLGIVYKQLDMGTAILMIVVAVMMQMFVHLYFSNAVKSGNFGGIAGYDSKTEYCISELKRLLARMDRHIGIVSTGCMALLFAGALAGMLMPEIGEKESAIFLAAVSGAYFLEFIFSIAYFNYQSIDDIFVNDIDKQRSRAGWVSSVVFLLFIIGTGVECIILFAVKNIKNNTAPAMQCGAYVILICIIAGAGLFAEQSRVKKMKSFEKKYRPGKGFAVSVIGALVSMIVMAVTL